VTGYTARELLQRSDEFRAHVAELRDDVKLGEIWQTLIAGRSVTSQEAELLITDILLTAGYFEIAPDDVPGHVLQRREGKREVAARILFLADLPGSYITKLRRQALDELQKLEARE
jgi:hypothetical protein